MPTLKTTNEKRPKFPSYYSSYEQFQEAKKKERKERREIIQAMADNAPTQGIKEALLAQLEQEK